MADIFQNRKYSDFLTGVSALMGDENVWSVDQTLLNQHFNDRLEEALSEAQWREVCPYGQLWPVDRFNEVRFTPEDRLKWQMESWFPLSEDSGNAVDSHGSNDATDNNTVSVGTGKVGVSRNFTIANSEFFETADNASLSTGDIDFSLSIWVNLTAVAADQVIVSKSDSASVREYELYYDTSRDQFAWECFDSSGTSIGSVYVDAVGKDPTDSTERVAIRASTWYHLAVKHSKANNEVAITLNGLPWISETTTGTPSDTAANFRIGARFSTEQDFLGGDLNLLGFWKRELNLGDVNRLYNEDYGLDYPFDEQFFTVGTVFDVWRDDPVANNTPQRVVWLPAGNGVQIIGSTNSEGSVYMHYRRRFQPRLNTNAAGDWLTGTTFTATDVTYHVAQGHWYSSRFADAARDPATAANVGPYWLQMPFPGNVYEFVRWACFSDMLIGDGETTRSDRMLRRAENRLLDGIDKLYRQQRFQESMVISTHVSEQGRRW